MKKWNNPELLSLGVENTFEELDTQAANKPINVHYCHNKNADGSDIGWHPNDTCNNSKDNGCKGTDLCNWKGEPHKSKCCGTIGVS